MPQDIEIVQSMSSVCLKKIYTHSGKPISAGSVPSVTVTGSVSSGGVTGSVTSVSLVLCPQAVSLVLCPQCH